LKDLKASTALRSMPCHRQQLFHYGGIASEPAKHRQLFGYRGPRSAMMRLIMMQSETAKLILDSLKTHQFERCPLVGGPFF